MPGGGGALILVPLLRPVGEHNLHLADELPRLSQLLLGQPLDILVGRAQLNQKRYIDKMVKSLKRYGTLKSVQSIKRHRYCTYIETNRKEKILVLSKCSNAMLEDWITLSEL